MRNSSIASTVKASRWTEADFRTVVGGRTEDRTRQAHAATGRCPGGRSKALKAQQAQERLAARSAYSSGCGDCGGQHLVVNELGYPIRPEWFSDQFQRMSVAAGLPVIRLHDARHTCGTLMHLRGVPTAVISKWLGHATAAFTMSVYVHSQDDALAAAGDMYGALIRGSQSGV